jgi:hypothetical protein
MKPTDEAVRRTLNNITRHGVGAIAWFEWEILRDFCAYHLPPPGRSERVRNVWAKSSPGGYSAVVLEEDVGPLVTKLIESGVEGGIEVGEAWIRDTDE